MLRFSFYNSHFSRYPLYPQIVFLGIVIFTSLVSNGSSNTIAVTYTKEEFIEVLEILNGGSDSSVPDFLFFTQSSLQTYANTVGPPRNRTEKRRPSRPHPPNRLPADVTLSRASERLRKGQNVEVINKWARVLDILLFNQNNKLVPTNKECAAFKMLGFDTSVVCSSKSKKKNHNGKREQKLHKESPRDRKRLLDILTLQVRDDDDDDDNDDDDEEEDQIQEEDKIQDGVVKDDMRNDEGSFRGKFKRKIVEDEGYHPRHHQRHSHDLKGRSPIQTIDIDRMRRSLPFTYSEIGECYEEGTQGTTDDTILLCETCYKTVDFGSDV